MSSGADRDKNKDKEAADNDKDGSSALMQTVGDKFRVGRKLGGGSFGEIRLGFHVDTGEEVAVKLERRNVETKQLPLEYRFYKMLGNAVGVPRLFYFGPTNEYNALVLELLGPSLEDMFAALDQKFSVKTICLIAIQLIERIEYVHTKKILYRDIKPENFLLGNQKHQDKKNIIYIIDFGLAKEYQDEHGNHIPWTENKALTGTARYMSINMHKKYEQGRRDDLESIAYVLFYFLRGRLPWQGLKADSALDRYKKIGECKEYTSIRQLLDNDKHPREFGEYLRMVKNLRFDEIPDYETYKNLFKRCIKHLGYKKDEIYDWYEMQQNSEREG